LLRLSQLVERSAWRTHGLIFLHPGRQLRHLQLVHLLLRLHLFELGDSYKGLHRVGGGNADAAAL
jgi:hypothetical protein